MKSLDISARDERLLVVGVGVVNWNCFGYSRYSSYIAKWLSRLQGTKPAIYSREYRCLVDAPAVLQILDRLSELEPYQKFMNETSLHLFGEGESWHLILQPKPIAAPQSLVEGFAAILIEEKYATYLEQLIATKKQKYP